jgi:hypothetical protein
MDWELLDVANRPLRSWFISFSTITTQPPDAYTWEPTMSLRRAIEYLDQMADTAAQLAERAKGNERAYYLGLAVAWYSAVQTLRSTKSAPRGQSTKRT